MQRPRSTRVTLVLLALAFLVWPEGRARGAEATAQDRSSTSPSFQQQTLPPEQRGDLLMIHHQYLQAIDAYQQAPRDSAVVRNKLGIAYHHVFALDQAKTSYQEALRLKPKYGEALNNLGAVFYAQKDYRRAEKLYHRALKLLPQSATVYNNLGTAYFAHGKLKQGTEAYRTAFAIDPKVFSADPIETISEASSSEERARLDFCLAELFAQSGMKDQAILYLRKALDAGFSDNKRLMQDEGFASIRHTAEFAQLMAMVKQP